MDYQKRAQSLVEQTKQAAQTYCERHGLVGTPAFQHLVGRLEGLVLAMAQEQTAMQQRLDEADDFIRDEGKWDDFRAFCGVDVGELDCMDDFAHQARIFNRDGMGGQQ